MIDYQISCSVKKCVVINVRITIDMSLKTSQENAINCHLNIYISDNGLGGQPLSHLQIRNEHEIGA